MAIYLVDDEVNWGRRAFPVSQRLLSGVPVRQLDPYVNVGWYDTRAHEETGAFATVDPDGRYADLVGEILRVTYGVREAFVYVVGFADIPDELALYRRAFLHLSLLTRDMIPCVVEVVA